MLIAGTGACRPHLVSPGADLAAAPLPVPDLATPRGEPSLPRGRVRGFVTRDGHALAGVLVQLATAGRTRGVRSDEQGRYELADLTPGAYALVADVPALALGVFVELDVGLDPDLPLLVERSLALVPTVGLAGSVRDVAGRALPGAVVRVEEEARPLPVEVQSDASGRFLVPGRLRGRSYRVSVRRAEYLPDGPRLVRAGASPVEIRLQRGASLVGLLVDERGAPVADAEVAVVSDEEGGEAAQSPSAPALRGPGLSTSGDAWAQLEPAGELGVLRGPIPFPPMVAAANVPAAGAPATRDSRPRSDAKGGFRIDELRAGRVIVTARHPDFADGASLALVLQSGAVRTLRLELVRGATLRGRVLDERGAGLGDAQISSSDGRAVVSDASGRFVLAHLVRRTQLTARHQGYLRAEASVEIGEGQAEALVDLRLARALGRLGGQVVEPGGRGVAGARVQISPTGSDPVLTTTDPSGRFLEEGLPDGPYRVIVEHADFARLSLPAIEASSDARLLLRPGGGLEGELFDPRTGGPPADARLELFIGSERRVLALTGRRFRALGIPSGPVRLRASARGYARVTLDLEVAEAERPGEITLRDLRVQLELGGQVRGRVRDDRGEPIAGAEVELASAPDAVDPVRTDAAGAFTLLGVPSGRARIRVRWRRPAGAEPGGAKAAVRVEEELEVRANEESRLDLSLP